MKITPLSLLLATTFLSTSAMAQTVTTINADYLNSLTGDKVTWEEVTASGEDTVQIGGKYYKYTYHKPDNYTETSERIDNALESANVTNVVFRDIAGDDPIIDNDKNNSYIDIVADFVNCPGGPAIRNFYEEGSIGNINTTVINTEGIVSTGAKVENLSGNFINNLYGVRAVSFSFCYNGDCDNYEAKINNVSGNFIGNNSLFGAAFYGVADNITGKFIGNNAYFIEAMGGAITNQGAKITGDFMYNYARGSLALGGAIFGMNNIISGNFVNNYVKEAEIEGYEQIHIAAGGAIASAGGLTLLADGQTNLFSGNYVEDINGTKINNAIFVVHIDDPEMQADKVINFEVKNNGSFIFDDEIDGGYLDLNTLAIVKEGYSYNINLYGDKYNTSTMDETNTIRFNDLVNNVYDFNIDSVQMALGKNAVINIVHNYVAQNNPYLRLDLDAVNRKVGQINIDGDVDGTTNVIVNVLQNKETAKEESIVFATAKNDTLGDEVSFKVSRVIGSPYMWEVSYNDTNKQWGLYSTEEQNPDYEEDNPDTPVQPLGPIEVAPEVVATVAVKTAGLSQTNGMVYNIMRKVGVNRLFCPGCGFYDYNWDGEAFHNVWVDTTYNGLTIEAPVEIDAKVWGIEAGSDLQHDLNNKLGIFVSYRQGSYEMDGKGEKYYSNIGSEIDIDSYLAGLYYRYDYNDWYAFATLYGGMQNAEIQTDDGVANYDTDGIEFGGSIEAGYNYALTRTLSVTPSLGVFYSQISYDDATDNVGKTVEYNDLKQVELEAGAKFAYTQYTDDGFYSLYVKPSVVQTLIDGDEIEVTEIGKVDTVEDKTLGRIEFGGNIGFNENWSAYGWANYTFGSDYEATSLGLGLNYAW